MHQQAERKAQAAAEAIRDAQSLQAQFADLSARLAEAEERAMASERRAAEAEDQMRSDRHLLRSRRVQGALALGRQYDRLLGRR